MNCFDFFAPVSPAESFPDNSTLFNNLAAALATLAADLDSGARAGVLCEARAAAYLAAALGHTDATDLIAAVEGFLPGGGTACHKLSGADSQMADLDRTLKELGTRATDMSGHVKEVRELCAATR